MKVFLSALENGNNELILKKVKMLYNLMSFYYIKGKRKLAEEIRDKSELIMIDSGAHSFQKGTKVNWVEYTYQYAQFIKEFDRPNVVGYFEMDVDNIMSIALTTCIIEAIIAVLDTPFAYIARKIKDVE